LVDFFAHLNALLEDRRHVSNGVNRFLWWTGGGWVVKFGIGRAKNCLFKKFLRMILVFRGEYIVENTTKSSAIGEKMSS